MPDESVDFFDGVLDLVVGVGGFNPQLENQSVELVHNESDLDTLLEGVSNYFFRIYHDLGWARNPTTSAQKGGMTDDDRPLREHLQRVEYHQPT